MDTAVQLHAAATFSFGAKDLKNAIRKFLETDTQFKREYGKPVDGSLVEFLFENVCECSPSALESESSKGRKERDISRSTITLEDKKFSIGDVRQKAFEILFHPKTIGQNILGLGDLVYDVVMKCEAEKRPALLENIIITGTHCNLKGLSSKNEQHMIIILQD